jgi:hypothetical protein
MKATPQKAFPIPPLARPAPLRAFFMVILADAIVLVALPPIGADVGFSEQGLQWVVSVTKTAAFHAARSSRGRDRDARVGRGRSVRTGASLTPASARSGSDD